MPASERYCMELVLSFDQFPNWGFISETTKASLAKFLAQNARDDHEAHAAVCDLLADTARASSSQTNRVPTTGELKLWLESQRPAHPNPPPPTEKRGCGAVFAKYQHPDGGAARCEDSWLRTVKRVIPTGRTEPEDFEVIGKCPKCYPGWYSTGKG